MCAQLVKCEHCNGTKVCRASGGRSCKVCLRAAGMGQGQWATVRCSYCGGRGFALVKDDAAATDAPAAPESLADAARAAEAAQAAESEPTAEPAEAPAADAAPEVADE